MEPMSNPSNESIWFVFWGLITTGFQYAGLTLAKWFGDLFKGKK